MDVVERPNTRSAPIVGTLRVLGCDSATAPSSVEIMEPPHSGIGVVIVEIPALFYRTQEDTRSQKTSSREGLEPWLTPTCVPTIWHHSVPYFGEAAMYCPAHNLHATWRSHPHPQPLPARRGKEAIYLGFRILWWAQARRGWRLALLQEGSWDNLPHNSLSTLPRRAMRETRGLSERRRRRVGLHREALASSEVLRAIAIAVDFVA